MGGIEGKNRLLQYLDQNSINCIIMEFIEKTDVSITLELGSIRSRIIENI